MHSKKLYYSALTVAIASLITACGGGGGASDTAPVSGAVTNTVAPAASTTIRAGKSLVVTSDVKAFFDSVESHSWKITQTAGDGAPTSPTFADPSCIGAKVVPGKKSLGSNPGSNGTSQCTTELVVPSDVPESKWLVENIARSELGGASGKFELNVLPAPKVVSGFVLDIPDMPLMVDIDQTTSIMANYTLSSETQIEGTAAYEWTQASGPSVAIAGAATQRATFLPSASGEYVFKVKVTITVKGKKEVREGSIVVIAESASDYVVSAGSVVAAPVGSTVKLNGSVTGSKVPSSLKYHWTQVSGPTVTLYGDETLTPEFVPSAAGDYEFALTVIRANGAQSSMKRSVTRVTAYAEQESDTAFFTVDAGSAQVALPGSIVTLSGQTHAGAVAPSNVSYLWTQESGPASALSSATSKTATFVPSQPGEYVFRFQASAGETSKSDTVAITVAAAPVTAFEVTAGNAQTTTTNKVINLEGAVTGTANLAQLTYLWTQQSGPNVNLLNERSARASFRPSAAGDYVFRLTVAQDGMPPVIKSAETMVVVSDATSGPAFNVSAGDSQVVESPASVMLNGKLIADESTPLPVAYKWVVVDAPGGPTSVTISNDTTLTASFVGNDIGLYTFQITATIGEVVKSSVTSVLVKAPKATP